MKSLFLIDWVSFTSKVHDVLEIIELLGLTDCNFQAIKGACGDQDRLYYDGISVHFNGRADMGVWCEMSGHGCRVFETHGTGDYRSIFLTVLDNKDKMNITRLDIAFDDHDGLLNIQDIFDDTREKNFVSKFDWYKHEAGSEGTTVYFGSPRSDIRIRIYDKAAEQKKTGNWIRVELQLRDDRALAFAKAIDEISKTFLGIMSNYLRFVEPQDGDTNNRRWPTTAYWQNFLKGAEKVTLYTKPGTEYNLGNLQEFVINQAGGAIDAYLKLLGMEELQKQLKNRSAKMNPKYVELIQRKTRQQTLVS